MLHLVRLTYAAKATPVRTPTHLLAAPPVRWDWRVRNAECAPDCRGYDFTLSVEKSPQWNGTLMPTRRTNEPYVLVERHDDDKIWVLTLNDPDRRNPMSPSLTADLNAALVAYRDDPHARVAILTGAGSAFCAGADLNELDSRVSENRPAPENYDFTVMAEAMRPRRRDLPSHLRDGLGGSEQPVTLLRDGHGTAREAPLVVSGSCSGAGPWRARPERRDHVRRR